MIRTGYSFRVAYGHLADVLDRVASLGWKEIPVTDRNNTFSFNRLTIAAKERGLRPIYGDDYYAAFIVDPDGYRIEAYFGPGER